MIFAALLFLPCTLVAQSIVEADEEIELTSANQRLFASLAKTTLPIPFEPTKKGQAILVFTVGAGFTEMVAVALPPEKAENLALAIHKEVSNTSLRYGSDEGKAIVKGSRSSAAIGKTSGSIQIEVGKLAGALRE